MTSFYSHLGRDWEWNGAGWGGDSGAGEADGAGSLSGTASLCSSLTSLASQGRVTAASAVERRDERGRSAARLVLP